MLRVLSRGRLSSALIRLCLAVLCAPLAQAVASEVCPAERPEPLEPKDPKLCAELEAIVRRPSALALDQYEARLGQFLQNFCHRDKARWKADKRLRDTGPYIATLANGRWTGRYFGTHAPVYVWYSQEMYDWLRTNRPADREPASTEPVPDGAIMVKEMYPQPAAACAGIDPARLLPTQGAAVMVRDAQASRDGWFWGWFGWSGWQPDWPPDAKNSYPNMGFGQYCTNCHASAKDNQTFASLRNIANEPGEPLVFLSQNFFLDPTRPGHHDLVANPPEKTAPTPAPLAYNPDFTKALTLGPLPPPARDAVASMPSQTYDNVWAKPKGPTAISGLVTSDQCIGCHDAGGTGLQFGMTEPGRDGTLLNVSPYATWRSSPMGLSGRDPIFFAQLASETERFHPKSAAAVENACLGCHGILGQRQFAVDRYGATGRCEPYARADVNAVPFPDHNPLKALADYAGLARDGVSCTACHHMALGKAEDAKYRDAPQNRCLAERRDFLTPNLTGLAATFSGSFALGPPDVLYGPFREPKPKPMKNALGMAPEHNHDVTSSELCGSCHTVHLPVLSDGKVVGYGFEQATYPEWAFSDYRTGDSPDGKLPLGPGPQAQSCQGCHMPNRDAAGNPLRSKIAGIQEYSSFPQADHNLPPADIDLEVRSGFSKHTLVGLNIFLTRMAQQFPDILGIRTQDPMLVDKGLDPIRLTENEMLDQAAKRTAGITVGKVETDGGTLSAVVTVTNRAGHKLPSGVAFRRAFLEFSVLDDRGGVLWSSGRTDGAGRIVDREGVPIAGEVWWKDDCSARIEPLSRRHQPHYEVIERQDQAQIYEELTAAPSSDPAPQCGVHAKPAGPLTTSFLSICTKVKDNRLLPHGFLTAEDRTTIAEALGAGPELAEEVGPTAVGDDPDYRSGGRDSITYRVPLKELGGKTAAAVRATLYYQATPPYFLQDRFCTSRSEDTKRLYFLAGNLDLARTPAQGWKLRLVTTGPVPVP